MMHIFADSLDVTFPETRRYIWLGFVAWLLLNMCAKLFSTIHKTENHDPATSFFVEIFLCYF